MDNRNKNKMEDLRKFLNDFIKEIKIELLEEDDWKLQAFNTRNIVNDFMINIYAKDCVYIDRGSNYIEIFGLTEEEYKSLSDLLNIR